MHHFKAIGEFKLGLQSGNATLGQNWRFLSRVTLTFGGQPCKTVGHIFYATSSFVHCFMAIIEFKLELQSGNAQFGSKSGNFLLVWPCDLVDVLENNMTPLLLYSLVYHFIAIGEFKLELQSTKAQFGSNRRYIVLCHYETWQMTSKHNRALGYATVTFEFKPELRSRHAKIGAKFVLTSVTFTFDLWPLPFAWTPLLSIGITPANFIMIHRQEHKRGWQTDGRTDEQTDGKSERSVLRAAWSHLKVVGILQDVCVHEALAIQETTFGFY